MFKKETFISAKNMLRIYLPCCDPQNYTGTIIFKKKKLFIIHAIEVFIKII